MSEVKRRSKSSKSSNKPEEDKEDKENKELSPKKSKSKEKKEAATSTKEEDGPPVHPKFGPMPKLSPHRLWSRSALILGLMAVVWWNSNKKNETSIASVGEDIRFRGMKTKCSPSFDKKVANYPACVPNHCGRIITDELISPEELFALNDLATRGFKEGQKGAAATILDLSTGMLKYSGKSVDLYNLNKTSSKKPFQHGDLLIFQSIKSKLMRMVSSYFGIDYWSIFLSAPVYLSRISEKQPKHKSDEYWHLTVHQELYDSFDYSTVLFLSDFGRDFDGGRFIFTDGDNTNRTIDPRRGRAIAFTSGGESRHFHERLRSGSRLALTMGFTCDPKKAKKDPPL